MGIRLETAMKYPILIIEQAKKEYQYLSVFKNSKNAKAELFNWVKNFGICIKKTSVVKNDEGPCSNYVINKCDGACIGVESHRLYREKINALLDSFKYPFSSFIIVSRGRKTGESSFVYIENNNFKGYGYFDLYYQIKSSKQIISRLVSMEDNSDTQKLISNYLRKKKYNKLIPLDNI